MEFLSDSEAGGSNNFSVIAIVGMGGLGKTTLAQLAYKDDVVPFDFKLWVCVSENFDLVQLTRAMIQSSTQRACDLSELDPLQVMLKAELGGKRFLLVLDDIWEEKNLSSYWDRLIAPLRYGSQGSKIIITTRSERVSKMTRATSTYHLPCLQGNDCWKLISQLVFEGRDLKSYPNLTAIGTKISERCGGLPLVAKTLGGLLRCEDDEQKWNDILHSDIWDIGEENGIMAVLKLSYEHLPVHLRRCFRYCSVFPKNYKFDKVRIVRMWMAHGYIQEKGTKRMEDIGKEWFDDLLYRSFFQTSQISQAFLMHDLIRDLARLVSEGECHSVEGSMPCSIPKHVQHLSIVSSSDPSSITSLQEHMCELGNLRSFLVIHPRFSWEDNLEALNDLFTKTKHLRLLDLTGTGLWCLPNSIGCLKHLRYLGLRDNPIEELPESVGSLYHLRHLLMDHFTVAYPVGIGKLTNLQTMPGFCVSGKHGHAKLGELKDINKVQRSLLISGIENLTDAREAKKACLEKKENIQSLRLKWEQFSAVGPSPVDDEVLESLRPNPNLERICIHGFRGLYLPSWLGHPSFTKLSSVELIECRNCTSLPPLGRLPSLRRLSIVAAREVKYIGCEFFAGAFPQLEKLVLKYMDKWESWCGAQQGECPHLKELHINYCDNLNPLSLVNLNALEHLDISSCNQLQFTNVDTLPPTLKILDINGCTNLTSLPLGMSSALQVLTIDGCPSLTAWCQYHRQRLVHIPKLRVKDIERHVVLRNVFGVQEAKDIGLGVLQRLWTLDLVWDGNSGQRSFSDVEPEEVLENLRPHGNLQKLVIQGYVGLKFATWLGDPSFSNLVFVTLRGCSRCELLPPLGRLPHLMGLRIEGAHSLRATGNEFFKGSRRNSDTRAFPSLRKLEFLDMPNWEQWAEAEDGYLPRLCELMLEHCPMLKALPRLPPSLEELVVANCHVNTFSHPWDHLTSLRNLKVSHIPTLNKLPDLAFGLTKMTLQGLPVLTDLAIPTSLRSLVLEGCSQAMFVESLPCLTHLTSLRISDFPELATIPLQNMKILLELHISNCPELLSLDRFSFSQVTGEYTEGLQALKSLEHLSISDCPKLHCSANERPPSALQSMEIDNCPSLASWHEKHRRNR